MVVRLRAPNRGPSMRVWLRMLVGSLFFSSEPPQLPGTAAVGRRPPRRRVQAHQGPEGWNSRRVGGLSVNVREGEKQCVDRGLV